MGFPGFPPAFKQQRCLSHQSSRILRWFSTFFDQEIFEMFKKVLKKFWRKFNQHDLQVLIENTDEDNESQPKTSKGRSRRRRSATIDEVNYSYCTYKGSDKGYEIQIESKKKKESLRRRATIATIDMTLLNQEDKQKIQEIVLYQNLYAVGL